MGKTLAIVGLGRIGREVAARMQAFGMKVYTFHLILLSQCVCVCVYRLLGMTLSFLLKLLRSSTSNLSSWTNSGL